MKRALFIAICVLTMTACGTSLKATDDNNNVRWPDFLREWAADYEIKDAHYLAIIDQIDTLYQLVDDSTSDRERLCGTLCQMQSIISNVIRQDSSLVFPLMMRATARNFYGKIYNNPRLLELDCPCNVLDYLIIDAQWNTSSRANLDLMYTTILGLSWQAENRFANIMLGKEDGNDKAISLLLVYNYTDTIINNLQLFFTDGEGNLLEKLTEGDTYVDSPDAGIKRMQIPPYLLMSALADKGTITISYETPNGMVEMIGYPHIYFMEQIEDCPRLKELLNQAMAE